MLKVRVLNQQDVEKTLDMKQVISAVENVYMLKANREAAVWPMVFHEFKTGVADMDIKSGYLKGADIYGLKLVSWYGENQKKGILPLIGTTMVFDMSTGAPVGILSAEYITGMRTGAAGAIGAKYLAKPNAENFLMVGTGHQSAFQIAASLIALENKDVIIDRSLAIVRENIDIIEAWITKDPNVSWVRPKSGSTTFIKYHFDIPSTEFCKRLLDEQGVLVIPGSAMEYEGHFRVGSGNNTENLKVGLERISAFMKNL